MTKPKHHLFVCGSFRGNGQAQGACARKNSLALLQYFQSEIEDRGLEGVEVAATGCLNLCLKGPVVIDYPSNHWYQGVDEAAADDILDAIETGGVAEGRVMTGGGNDQ